MGSGLLAIVFGLAVLVVAPWWARLCERSAGLFGERSRRLMAWFMPIWLWWARGCAVLCIAGGALVVAGVIDIS